MADLAEKFHCCDGTIRNVLVARGVAIRGAKPNAELR
jgi:hypothetical protein